jgi:hypothetical protein
MMAAQCRLSAQLRISKDSLGIGQLTGNFFQRFGMYAPHGLQYVGMLVLQV